MLIPHIRKIQILRIINFAPHDVSAKPVYKETKIINCNNLIFLIRKKRRTVSKNVPV